MIFIHKSVFSILMIALTLTFLGAGCYTVPQTQEKRNIFSAQVREATAIFKAKDPTIQRLFKRSYGYAVLPRVVKGAFVLGGAQGRGEVYERSRMIGYCNMMQATLGFSYGGEFFREIIFFRNKYDMDKFKSEEFTFSAQVTAVALTAGAAAKIDYKDGMAVFIMTDTGLMVDASVGGQKFSFIPYK